VRKFLPPPRPAEILLAFFFSNAFDSIPDRQGRVLIPQNLRTYADILNETIIIGVMNRVEIWNPQRWADVFSKVEEDPETIATQLHELGIKL
jgi:MraZ protein